MKRIVVVCRDGEWLAGCDAAPGILVAGESPNEAIGALIQELGEQLGIDILFDKPQPAAGGK